jgi:MarR family transcriptional regulator, organic hydroperoxide resistance regulator
MTKIEIITLIMNQMMLIGEQIDRSIVESGNAIDSEITILQFRICLAIHRIGSIKMSELAKIMGLKTPSLTQIVDKLVALKMVQRQDDPEDRRAILVSLTKKGVTEVSTIKKLHDQIIKNKFEVLNDSELQMLLTIFQKLNNNQASTNVI